MKWKTILLSSALSVGIAATAFAQNPSTTPSQDPSMQNPSSQSGTSQSSPTSATSGSSATETSFTGSIAKNGGKYVLHSATGDYALVGDQDQAKNFEGKDVKVTGALDPTGKTIRVKSIEPSTM